MILKFLILILFAQWCHRHCHSIDLYKDAIQKKLSIKEIEIITNYEITTKLYNEFKNLWSNEQIKLISEIDKALLRIKDDTYGYCLDTAEPIGLKRLMARPVAKYTIAAQEKHEKNEKVHADD